MSQWSGWKEKKEAKYIILSFVKQLRSERHITCTNIGLKLWYYFLSVN